MIGETPRTHLAGDRRAHLVPRVDHAHQAAAGGCRVLLRVKPAEIARTDHRCSYVLHRLLCAHGETKKAPSRDDRSA